MPRTMHVAAEPRSQVQSLLMVVVITLMVKPRLALSMVLSAAGLVYYEETNCCLIHKE